MEDSLSLKGFWDEYDRMCKTAEIICEKYKKPTRTEEDKAKFKVLFEYFRLAEVWRFHNDSRACEVLMGKWYRRLGREDVKANELVAFYIAYRNYFENSDSHVTL